MEMTAAPFMKNYLQLCEDGWQQGWHERNGGNFTYRLTKEDVRLVEENFQYDRPWVPIGLNVENLAGEFFAVTGSGKYFRNALKEPDNFAGIIEIDSTGEAYRIVWGLTNGGRPTSEIPTHLYNHSVKKKVTKGSNRIIYHAHTPNVIALTFVLPLTDRDFSRVLWKTMTECPVVFPQGVGVVPWMVPGGIEIGFASGEKMEKYDVVIWAHHGTFCAGPDFDTAFGLMHTVEKSAEIYIKALSCGMGIRQDITDEGLRAIGRDFHVDVNEEFLD